MASESVSRSPLPAFQTAEQRSHEDDVKDHVKQTWEKIKIDLTSDDEEDVEIEQDDDVKMSSPPERLSRTMTIRVKSLTRTSSSRRKEMTSGNKMKLMTSSKKNVRKPRLLKRKEQMMPTLTLGNTMPVKQEMHTSHTLHG